MVAPVLTVSGSIPDRTGEFGFIAWLAQSVERKPFKLVAVGSIPTPGTIEIFFLGCVIQFTTVLNRVVIYGS